MDKIRNWIMGLLFVMLAMILGMYIYLSQVDGVYLNKPIVFHYWYGSGLITHMTTKNSYQPGEIVYAKIIAHKDRVWPAIIQWTLADGCHHAYPPRAGVLEKGRNERTVAVERLAPDTKPGEDYFYGSVSFDLNMVRPKLHIPIRTNTFTVE